MLLTYNPSKDIDPELWLACDEGRRIALIEIYHEEAGMEAPNMSLHAVFHNIIETQIALGDKTPVAAKFAQLRKEGLDRHEAIHALASVCAAFMYDISTGSDVASENASTAYFDAIRELTKEKWHGNKSGKGL